MVSPISFYATRIRCFIWKHNLPLERIFHTQIVEVDSKRIKAYIWDTGLYTTSVVTLLHLPHQLFLSSCLPILNCALIPFSRHFSPLLCYLSVAVKQHIFYFVHYCSSVNTICFKLACSWQNNMGHFLQLLNLVYSLCEFVLVSNYIVYKVCQKQLVVTQSSDSC